MSRLDLLAEQGLVRPHVPLAPLTTYKLGGPARWLAEPADEDALAALAAGLDPSVPVLALGRGSNVVVGEGGFPGLVIRLTGAFNRISVTGGVAEAGGAVALPQLARATAKEGWGGLEFFVGIPGSVGGAVRQNAGCHGSETVDVLVDATVLDLDTGGFKRRNGEELDLSYRHSGLGPREIVTSARFRLRPAEPSEAEARMREITRWRKEHQPGGTLNAGSVFKNPPGDFAGRLIDELGLKGLRVGGVSVSTKHANFFVAEEGATPSEIRRLVEEVARRVEEGTGVRLEPEIQFAGVFERGGVA